MIVKPYTERFETRVAGVRDDVLTAPFYFGVLFALFAFMAYVSSRDALPEYKDVCLYACAFFLGLVVVCVYLNHRAGTGRIIVDGLSITYISPSGVKDHFQMTQVKEVWCEGKHISLRFKGRLKGYNIPNEHANYFLYKAIELGMVVMATQIEFDNGTKRIENHLNVVKKRPIILNFQDMDIEAGRKHIYLFFRNWAKKRVCVRYKKNHPAANYILTIAENSGVTIGEKGKKSK